ncbi:MAG: hypothetical protein KDN22_06075 [Verrucomicrobiae bacterium]|nr:hypothetical protein [Verrucomicrobiae bacterium]
MLRHHLSAAAAVLVAGSALPCFAGDEMPTLPSPPLPLAETKPSSSVSGSLSLDVNTHFISYGADIWGGGNDFEDALFNPSLELAWDLGNDFTFTLGTWWDINDKAVSSIGKNVQEVDVWAGISYGGGPVEISLTYQEWMYAEESERIVDLGLGFDAPLSPSLTIHGRVDDGASGGDLGVVAVAGIELPSFSLGAVEFSLPVNVAFATDGFHGGDAGFAYASAGVGASIPLAFMGDTMGSWALNAGVTYYYTNSDVIPNNPDESFFTGNVGIGLSF